MKGRGIERVEGVLVRAEFWAMSPLVFCQGHSAPVLHNPDQRGKGQKLCQVFQQECWQLPHPSWIWQNMNHSALG